MDKNKFNNKKNIKTYSIYKSSKRRNKRFFRFSKMLFLFLGVALVSYFVSLIVYSFVNRKHCESVVIDDSYDESKIENKNLNKNQDRQQGLKILDENIKAVEAPKNIIFNKIMFKSFLKNIKKNNHNAVIVTLKDEAGNILYNTNVSLAEKWKTVNKQGVADIEGVIKAIKEEGLIPIAKINVFKDQKATSPERENTFVFEDDEYIPYKFKDKETGSYLKYLDPESIATKKYIFDIIKEIKSCGFSYILLQNVSYPDCEFSEKMKGSDTINRNMALKKFFRELKELKARFIVGYDWDVLKNSEGNLSFGGDIKKFNIDINMPIIYRYEDFKEYKEEILNLAKNKRGVVVIPKLEFKRNLNRVFMELKEENLNSYVILQSS